MSLSRVWIETLDDGLVRADQVVQVLAHQTAAFAGKPGRWLLDVVLPVSQGAGAGGQWHVAASHRTLLQVSAEPRGAARRLTGLLYTLDTDDASGIVTAEHVPAGDTADGAEVVFRFHAFPLTG